MSASTLWLTDRSRWRLGAGRCARARYLANHVGQTGYGITTRSESLPLATGTYTHQGLEALLRYLQVQQALPGLGPMREIIGTVQEQYVARVTERGYRGILSSAHTEETITEQSVLLSGLLWAVRQRFLPWFHLRYQVIEVEQERLHLLGGCDCGAGALPAEQHAVRGCHGRALMLRTDCLARRREVGTLAYFEAKTTGWESDAWTEQWETDPQLGLGTLDLEARYGSAVDELYILTLSKGARRKDKSDPDGRKKQQTSLCYGYRRPGNPPFTQDEWRPAYEWVDENGEVKRVSRAHRRAGVWELVESDDPTWQSYLAQDREMPPEEYWVRTLPESVLDKVCFTLGPMNRQDHQIASVVAAMDAEEERWQSTLWTLYEAQTSGGLTWGDPAFQALLDRLVPQSWTCRPFGREHQCEFVPICHKEQGWQDPMGTGRYQPRLPHHRPELEQAIARGLLPESAAEAEEEER